MKGAATMFNLSLICRTANRFHKEGYTRHAAFVMAWRLARSTAKTAVAGVTHGERQQLIASLISVHEAVSVELSRETENLYDVNAIAVFIIVNGKSHKVGYIPTAAARLLAPIIDAGQSITATLMDVVGGWSEGVKYGLRLSLTF